MDIRQLRTFVHVAELGSLRRASERLHTAQPALSRQIQLLEAELKVALFERKGRGMVLTTSGQQLLPRAVSILRQMEDARADLAAESEGLRGHASIGMPPSVAEVLGGRLAARLARSYPNLSLRFVAGSSGYVLEWLQKGEVDFAILYDPHARLDLQATPLMRENLFLVAEPAAALSLKVPVDFASLAGRRLVLPSRRHGLRTLIEDAASREGLQLNVVIEADDLGIQKNLASQGLGDTVLPLAAVHRELQQQSLCAAPMVSPGLSRRLMVALPADRPASPAIHRCIAELRAEVADMVASGIWDGMMLPVSPE